MEYVTPHDEPHVIVSISSDGDVPAKFRTNEHTLGVLRLWFNDICDDTMAHIPEEDRFKAAAFKREHAKQILDFMKLHAEKAEHFIVHCDAGWCRSPATAAAISKIYEGDDSEFFKRYRPNSRVHRMILEEHFCPGGEYGNDHHRDQGS